MRITKSLKPGVSRASQRAYEHYLREDIEREARHRHNGVDTRERCDRCGKPMEPAEMVVGDFESFHAQCEGETE